MRPYQARGEAGSGWRECYGHIGTKSEATLAMARN